MDCIKVWRVLIVEDSALLAMELEMDLNEAGFETVHVRTIVAADAAIDKRRFDAVLLDYALEDGLSTTIAERLQQLGIPFSMMTGFDESLVRQLCPGGEVFAKPIDSAAVLRWMHSCF